MSTTTDMEKIFESLATGGTGITNFEAQYELLTQRAIDEWCSECLNLKGGKKPLYIGCQIPTYGPAGDYIEIPDVVALRSRTPGAAPARMAEFWAIHTAFKKAHEVIERIRAK